MNRLNLAAMGREDIKELQRQALNNYHAWYPNHVRIMKHSVTETKYLANGKAVKVPKEIKHQIGGII